MDLPPDLRPVLDAHGEALRELGYDVEPFGGGATRLRAVPAAPRHAGTPGRALERLLRDLKEREAADWAVAGTRDRLAATLACHSAVRAGQPLNAEQMSSIVRDVLPHRPPDPLPARAADDRARPARGAQPLVRADGLAAAVRAA